MSLEEYKSKRNFNKTNEPLGKVKRNKKKLIFCVQHHISRNDHYDFRLEYNGVLLSWAVPKGPSYNTFDKRLAIRVEDHPLDYANFEGNILKGEYGGGTVMLFDIGSYEMIEDFSKTLKKGYLKFKLNGKRLKGDWTIVTFKDYNLLIKENDGIKLYDDINEFKKSVKTNRTMKEIKEDIDKSEILINLTHPEKVVYKNPLVTKEDIFNYYKKVYDRMSKYLNNRLISTVRLPNLKKGEKFFKKHFPENKYLKKKIVDKEDYYYIDNKNAILNEVQLNSIEFHIWGSQINNINKPDIMVFDLDPDEKLDIDIVRKGVMDVKKILDELHLKSYLKTSGGKGYHIVVHFNKKYTWNKFKEISKKIAQILIEKYPNKYTDNVRLKKRNSKIFIDYLRNMKGSTFVAPYSLRIKDKPTVSMPIKWSELYKVKPDEITMEDALKRLKRKDPWEDFLESN